MISFQHQNQLCTSCMISLRGQVELPAWITFSSSIPLKIFAQNSQPERNLFWVKKPFLLKVIRRKEAPVAKRLLLENAELVWHCRLFLTGKDSKQLLKLGHLSHKRLEHLTELDTGLDWTSTLQHNNKDAGLISTTELEKERVILPFFHSVSDEGMTWQWLEVFWGSKHKRGWGNGNIWGWGRSPTGDLREQKHLYCLRTWDKHVGENLPRRPSVLRMKTLNIRQWKVSNLAFFLPDPYWCSMPSFVM